MAIVILPSALDASTGGARRLELDVADVKGVLDELQRRFPALTAWFDNGLPDLPEYVNIFVGDTDIRILQDLQTPLRPEDEVRLIVVMSGGAQP